MLGIFGTKISPPRIAPSTAMHEVDALVERDPEARHALVGDREDARSRDELAGRTGSRCPRLPITLP